MLNTGPRITFWLVGFMIRIPIKLYELKMFSFILTLRGGLDANASGISQKAIL